jgi:hypothetical protein
MDTFHPVVTMRSIALSGARTRHEYAHARTYALVPPRQDASSRFGQTWLQTIAYCHMRAITWNNPPDLW